MPLLGLCWSGSHGLPSCHLGRLAVKMTGTEQPCQMSPSPSPSRPFM
jgi:hypothetical protein